MCRLQNSLNVTCQGISKRRTHDSPAPALFTKKCMFSLFLQSLPYSTKKSCMFCFLSASLVKTQRNKNGSALRFWCQSGHTTGHNFCAPHGQPERHVSYKIPDIPPCRKLKRCGKHRVYRVHMVSAIRRQLEHHMVPPTKHRQVLCNIQMPTMASVVTNKTPRLATRHFESFTTRN